MALRLLGMVLGVGVVLTLIYWRDPYPNSIQVIVVPMYIIGGFVIGQRLVGWQEPYYNAWAKLRPTVVLPNPRVQVRIYGLILLASLALLIGGVYMTDALYLPALQTFLRGRTITSGNVSVSYPLTWSFSGRWVNSMMCEHVTCSLIAQNEDDRAAFFLEKIGGNLQNISVAVPGTLYGVANARFKSQQSLLINGYPAVQQVYDAQLHYYPDSLFVSPYIPIGVTKLLVQTPDGTILQILAFYAASPRRYETEVASIIDSLHITAN
jgi:hypothetical protein